MQYPVLLAIELSQRRGGVALRDARGEVFEETFGDSSRHDDPLIPAVQRIVTQAGLEPRNLDALGISIGPGGFTGLRISIAAAKMLGETLGVPIAPVPSAMVAAESTDAPERVLVALACKGETFWETLLERTRGKWHIVDVPGLVPTETFDPTRADAVLADQYFPAAARARCGAAAVPVIEPCFEARGCLRVASAMLDHGEVISPEAVLPLYPRPPEAVSLWERKSK